MIRMTKDEAKLLWAWTRYHQRFTIEYAGRFSRYLFELKRDMLDRAKQVMRTAEADAIAEAVTAGFAEYDRRLTLMVGPLYNEAAAGGASISNKEFANRGFNISGGHALSKDTIQAMADKTMKIKEVNQTIRDSLKGNILKAMNENSSPAGVQEAIRRTMGFTDFRSLMIARTEMGQAMALGRQNTADQAGIEEGSWMTAGDEVVRPSHVEAASVGSLPRGETFASTECEFPCDPNGPAGEIINCRCCWIPTRQAAVQVTVPEQLEIPTPVEPVTSMSMEEYMPSLTKEQLEGLTDATQTWISSKNCDLIRQIDRDGLEAVLKRNPKQAEFLKECQQYLEHLNRMITATSDVTISKTLYRGMDLFPEDFAILMNKCKVGSPFELEALTSFTTKKSLTSEFMGLGPYNKKVLFQVKNGRGAEFFKLQSLEGLHPNSVSLLKREQEVLIQKGSQFRVISIEEVNGRTIIKLEQLEQAPVIKPIPAVGYNLTQAADRSQFREDYIKIIEKRQVLSKQANQEYMEACSNTAKETEKFFAEHPGLNWTAAQLEESVGELKKIELAAWEKTQEVQVQATAKFFDLLGKPKIACDPLIKEFDIKGISSKAKQLEIQERISEFADSFMEKLPKGLLPDNAKINFIINKEMIRSSCYRGILTTWSEVDKEAIFHELGHYIEEHNPKIRAEAQKFLLKRTKGEPVERLMDLAKGRGFRPEELVKNDKFLDVYSGCWYEHPNGKLYATEILSMGLSYIFKNPLQFAIEDPEYFELLLKLLRGMVM